MAKERKIITTGSNHRADPPIGTTLTLLDFDGDAIVGWDPNAREPSATRRWPMLREHVRPVISTAKAGVR